MLGTKLDPEKMRSFVSTWDKEPESQGSYSVARPGAFKSRSLGGKPVEGIYFAGEAYDFPGPNDNGLSWQTYLPGAWRTGERAAKEIEMEFRKKAPK
jgi:monoamine oxidase